MTYEQKWKDFKVRVNIALSNDDEELANIFGTETESAGSDTRLQPCRKCGHYDCGTVTPGKPYYNCFHPGCIQGYITDCIAKVSGKSEDEILKELAKKYNIPVPHRDEAEENRQETRRQDVAFYHEQLLANQTAMDYLINERKRKLETIELMQIGLARPLELYKRWHEAGIQSIFSSERWNRPDDTLVLAYSYIDPHTGEVLRINTKAIPDPNDPDQKKHGFSVGKRTLYCSPKLNRNMVIAVEGENDLMALLEQGAESVVALGGKPSSDIIEELAAFKKVVLMLDNDEPGKTLTEELNQALPHIPVFQIVYDSAFKDPDEYYRECSDAKPIDDLLAAAVELETDNHRMTHKGYTWVFATRKVRMELDNLSRNKNGEFSGTLKVIEGDNQADIAYGQKLTGYKEQKEFALQFQAALEEYCDKGFEQKSMNDLLDIYPHSHRQLVIIPVLAAKYLQADRNETATLISKRLGQQVLDQVLRDVNEIDNQGLEGITDIPRMKISQFFNIPHNDGYFFFVNIVKEDSAIKKLPYLLSNNKELIPLHLLKKKTEHSLLLVNKRYELPTEVPQAFGEIEDISLSQVWAQKYINGEVKSEELAIGKLVASIENHIQQFYHHSDARVYEVIALWIIGTYYYDSTLTPGT